MAEPGRVRMTIDMPERLNDQVEQMAEGFCISKSDVLRLSVELMAAALRAHRDGLHVGAWAVVAGVRVEREFVALPFNTQVSKEPSRG